MKLSYNVVVYCEVMNLVIAVDAMGGDNAPREIVLGAVKASEFIEGKILLVGKEEVISEILTNEKYDKSKIEIINATEVIENDEKPTVAIRTKKDSSMVRAFGLLASGEADALVSAGSTGALLTGAVHFLKRIKGISRPALVPTLPSANDNFVIADSGANAVCKPQNLLQFAIMGSAYAKNVLGKENPRVGLLNIGAESGKGTDLVKEAYDLLKESSLNFVGNVEARDGVMGECDVVVCDGFSGNVLLKATEGTGLVLFKNVKEVFMGSIVTKFAALLLKKSLYKLKKKMDYKEYGGAPFLGVTKCVIKAHGTSDAKTIMHTIKQAENFAKSNFLSELCETMEKYSAEEEGGAEGGI